MKRLLQRAPALILIVVFAVEFVPAPFTLGTRESPIVAWRSTSAAALEAPDSDSQRPHLIRGRIAAVLGLTGSPACQVTGTFWVGESRGVGAGEGKLDWLPKNSAKEGGEARD